MASPHWTEEELQHAVKAYLQMLKHQRDQTPYVKTEINKQLQATINRSRGSVERRFQNISSILHKHNLPFVQGYAPLTNVGSTNEEKIWQLIQQLQDS